METLSANHVWTLHVVHESPITEIHTHLCAQPEETGDQIICLQDPMLVHLNSGNVKM